MNKNIAFGPNYIIPKPLDPRLLSTVAPAVAKAAIESGVAQQEIQNWDEYAIELNKRLGLDNQIDARALVTRQGEIQSELFLQKLIISKF